MANPSFTVPQQVAAFTLSVGAAAGGKFDSLADMQTYATKLSKINQSDTVIQGFMGSDWITIWGPVVWVNPAQGVREFVVDNTMACYYSSSQSLFVLAIAGTNPASVYDWGQEDVDIKALVPWTNICPISGPDSGNISTGTRNGMKALLGMQSGGFSMVSALVAFIKKQNIAGATIALGGHSLGGALAPCMGLYLCDNRVALELDNPNLAKQKIAVYAYAGPTPGDYKFADYYASRIKDASIAYSSVYNEIDIVPQAWGLETLKTIPTIYSGNIPFEDAPNNTFFGVLATNMQLSSLQAGAQLKPLTWYAQVKGRVAFKANFNSDVYNNCSTQVAALLAGLPVDKTYMAELGALVNVLYQADAQHNASYFGGVIYLPLPIKENSKNIWKSQPVKGYLGIDAYTVEYQKNLVANPPPTATFVSSAALAIKKLIGIDLYDMAALSAAQELKTAEDPVAFA